MSDNSNKPVHHLRIGTLSAAIFANQTQEGHVYYNAQFDRSYRFDGEWKHTKSMGRDDLLALAKLADLTHTWMISQKASNGDEPAPPEPQ
ncbi:MAG: hypothetical protein KDA86_15905 [Planctomycetaceae bacterium]|nr:hypothetical protein [Planctomycetaceae bacterium]